MKNIFFGLVVVLLLSSCSYDTAGGGKIVTSETSDITGDTPDIVDDTVDTSDPDARSNVYRVNVVDDAVLNSKVEAVGCDDAVEEGGGVYKLTCAKKPTVIVASGGYFKVDNEENTIDLPLMLNTSFVDGDMVITPASTFVANLTNRDEVEKFAAALGLSMTELFSLPTNNTQDIFRFLNAINTLAAENGVKDFDNFIKLVRDKILSYPSNSPSEALSNIKKAIKDLNNTDILKSFSFGFNGFLSDMDEINTTNIAKSMSKYTPGANEIMFTGFIYDEIIPEANVTAYYNGIEIGSAIADKKGKWRMALNISAYPDTSLLIFQAKKLNAGNNNVNVNFKSLVSKSDIGTKTKKLNINNEINLVLSNVTTAKYVIAEKILDKNSSTWNLTDLQNVNDKISKNYSNQLLQVSAAIRAMVYAPTVTGITQDTLKFAQDILTISDNNISTLDINITDINLSMAIPKQIAYIDNDKILSQQLESKVDNKVSAAYDAKTLMLRGAYNINITNSVIRTTSIKDINSTFNWTDYDFNLYDNKWKEVASDPYSYQWINNKWVLEEQYKKPISYPINTPQFLYSYLDDNLSLKDEEIGFQKYSKITTATMNVHIEKDNGEYSSVEIVTPDNAYEYIIGVQRKTDEFYKYSDYAIYGLDMNYTDIDALYSALEGSYVSLHSSINSELYAQLSTSGQIIEHNYIDYSQKVIGYYNKVDANSTIGAPAYINFAYNSVAKAKEYNDGDSFDKNILLLSDGKAVFGSKRVKGYETHYLYSQSVKDALATVLANETFDLTLPTIHYLNEYNSSNECTSVNISGNQYFTMEDKNNKKIYSLLNSDGSYLHPVAKVSKIIFPEGNFTKKSSDPFSIEGTYLRIQEDENGSVNIWTYDCNISDSTYSQSMTYGI
jgi:hypothetical protein